VTIDQNLTRRAFTFGTLTLAWAATSARADGGIALDGQGRAIKGYDTRAYFTESTAKLGSDAHTVDWNGATWQFATAEDAAAFAETPQAFAPQFGGYCTRAMSFKRTVPADPEVWRIHDGKLYMFARPVGGTKFDEGPEAMIARAQAFWETL